MSPVVLAVGAVTVALTLVALGALLRLLVHVTIRLGLIALCAGVASIGGWLLVSILAQDGTK